MLAPLARDKRESDASSLTILFLSQIPDDKKAHATNDKGLDQQ